MKYQELDEGCIYFARISRYPKVDDHLILQISENKFSDPEKN